MERRVCGLGERINQGESSDHTGLKPQLMSTCREGGRRSGSNGMELPY